MEGFRKIILNGSIGNLIDRCIQNGVLSTDYHPFIKAFREKMDSDGSFCGEFWGKWFTSAALAYQYRPSPDFMKMLEDTISEILALQEENGRISASAEDFTPWDLWGRKYVLLGFLAYYDLKPSKRFLIYVKKMADQLMAITTQEGGKRVIDTGAEALRGLPSCSILQAIVLLYERTEKVRYLEYAKALVDSWSVPSLYNPDGLCLLEQAVPGCAPAKIAVPKAYESMSCFAGVLDLYRVTGEQNYLDAVTAYMDAVYEQEIMITGSGSGGEFWCEGRLRQTQPFEAPMETCVTVAYMKLCRQLLEVTHEVRWANRLETSLYNALAGAMSPDGRRWASFSPLEGHRLSAQVQMKEMGTSCCAANGPRALLDVPNWCITQYPGGIAINLYEQGRYCSSYDNQPITILQETNYPAEGSVCLLLERVAEEEMILALRIPEWAEDTKIRIGKEIFYPVAGAYCELRARWRRQTRIQIDFHIKLRLLTAPGAPNYKALAWGPLILATDHRFPEEDGALLRLAEEQGAERVQRADSRIAFRVKFLRCPLHSFDCQTEEVLFRDYASCGNALSEDTVVRTWFPSGGAVDKKQHLS